MTQDEARAAREALFNQRPLLRFIFERGREAIDQERASNASNQQKIN